MPDTADTVARVQRRSPWRSRRGRSRPRSFRTRMTLATVRNFRKVWNTSPSRSCTSMLGSLRTIPLGSRTRPIGSMSASSLRSALASNPAVSRLRIVCSSSSEIVPFSRGVDHANAAVFQRHVDPSKMLHGCPSMMPGADPFGPRLHTITLRDSRPTAQDRAAGPLRHLGVEFTPGLFAAFPAARRLAVLRAPFGLAAALLFLGAAQIAFVLSRAFVLRRAGFVECDRDRLFRVPDLPLAVRGLEFAVLELVHDAFDRIALCRGLLPWHIACS